MIDRISDTLGWAERRARNSGMRKRLAVDGYSVTDLRSEQGSPGDGFRDTLGVNWLEGVGGLPKAESCGGRMFIYRWLKRGLCYPDRRISRFSDCGLSQPNQGRSKRKLHNKTITRNPEKLKETKFISTSILTSSNWLQVTLCHLSDTVQKLQVEMLRGSDSAFPLPCITGFSEYSPKARYLRLESLSWFAHGLPSALVDPVLGHVGQVPIAAQEDDCHGMLCD